MILLQTYSKIHAYIVLFFLLYFLKLLFMCEFFGDFFSKEKKENLEETTHLKNGTEPQVCLICQLRSSSNIVLYRKDYW